MTFLAVNHNHYGFITEYKVAAYFHLQPCSSMKYFITRKFLEGFTKVVKSAIFMYYAYLRIQIQFGEIIAGVSLQSLGLSV